MAAKFSDQLVSLGLQVGNSLLNARRVLQEWANVIHNMSTLHYIRDILRLLRRCEQLNFFLQTQQGNKPAQAAHSGVSPVPELHPWCLVASCLASARPPWRHARALPASAQPFGRDLKC